MIRALKREYRFARNYFIQRKFRKLIPPNVSELITSEDSSIHWKHLDVRDKNILDLGCGFWEIKDIQETSPVYFKNKGAKRIIGVDMNAGDLTVLRDYFAEHFKGDGSEFLIKKITSTNDLLELIEKYQIQSIKCDIEGFEKVMFKITKDQIKNITSLSVEYHDHTLFLNLVNTFKRWDFKIVNHSIFTYSAQNMGVLTINRD